MSSFIKPGDRDALLKLNQLYDQVQYAIGAGAAGGLNNIGVPGMVGFGVGIHPGPLMPGMMSMADNTYPLADNYGNYQYSDGSVMAWVPAHYCKVGTGSNGLAVNAVSIVPFSFFASVAAANSAGYFLPRAFYDGGAIRPGFFYDKYLCSKSHDGAFGSSIKNGVPISLTNDAGYTNSSTMPGCSGIMADAIVLCRARGAGIFNAKAIYQDAAIAMLTLAHAQASTNTTYCAWYDPINNFPKGCNNGALGDINDAMITYRSAGDLGSAAKPKTGSANLFARTTHNGQNCGIADVNGGMWQVALGVTNPGASATDATQITNGTAYVLKTSIALASLTGGFTAGATGTDAWGDAAHLGLLYDQVVNLFPWGADIDWIKFGNGTNQVFSEATSGDAWLRTCCGVQRDINATSAAGTNAYGTDGCNRYNRANLFALCAGTWNYASNAGVFCRNWLLSRSNASSLSGFRASAYG